MHFLEMKCGCGSVRFKRSSRRGFGEKLLGLVALPWRCVGCDRRVFKAAWFQPTRNVALPQGPVAPDDFRGLKGRAARLLGVDTDPYEGE